MKNILAFVSLCFIFTSCSSISTKTYNVETPLLEEQQKIRIVLVSDLHSTIYGKDQSTLIEKIKDSEPDLIVLSGDIFDDVVPMTGTKLLLSGIAKMPLFFMLPGIMNIGVIIYKKSGKSLSLTE